MITVDACLFVCAGLTAVTNASVWSFLVPLALGAAVLIVYGWKAAANLGIRSREETPQAWLRALGILSGITAALLTQTGRYAGLGIVACLVFLQVAERIIWAHFPAASHVAQGD